MNQVCPVELLTHAVSNTLSQEEETALQQHLERCDACCAKLEQLAGGLAWQNEAAFLLTSDELDVSIREPALWSETDFSVEQLEPSDDANALGNWVVTTFWESLDGVAWVSC